MSWITDFLKEIPLSAVLKEKIGIIEDKYAAMETQNSILEGDLRKAYAQITQLQHENQRLLDRIEKVTHKEVEDAELKLLKLIADLSEQSETWESVVKPESGLSNARFEYHVHNLEEAGYVSSNVSHRDYGSLYSLTQMGRRFLISKDML